MSKRNSIQTTMSKLSNFVSSDSRIQVLSEIPEGYRCKMIMGKYPIYFSLRLKDEKDLVIRLNFFYYFLISLSCLILPLLMYVVTFNVSVTLISLYISLFLSLVMFIFLSVLSSISLIMYIRKFI